MHGLSFGSRRVSRVARAALVLVGALGVSVVASQIAPSNQAHAASFLHYQRGYYVDNGWMCLGWANGAYHCTHHWYRDSAGQLVSTNPAWVPNAVNVSSSSSQSVSHTNAPAPAAPAPVYHAAPAAPAPAAPAFSGGSVQAEIQQVFGPYAGAALNVARCESGFNPNAKNPNSTASGVFQFLTSTWATTSYAGSSPFNASANIHAAYQVFARDGYSWREWQCQP